MPKFKYVQEIIVDAPDLISAAKLIEEQLLNFDKNNSLTIQKQLKNGNWGEYRYSINLPRFRKNDKKFRKILKVLYHK